MVFVYFIVKQSTIADDVLFVLCRVMFADFFPSSLSDWFYPRGQQQVTKWNALLS